MENKTELQIQREIIARNIINILDVKEQNQYTKFLNDDFSNQFSQYIQLKINNSLASQDIEQYLTNNKSIIEKISNNELISNDEKNQIFKGLKILKRIYILHK